MELYYEVLPDYVMQIKQLCSEIIRIWSGFVLVWLKINKTNRKKNEQFLSLKKLKPRQHKSFESHLKPLEKKLQSVQP